MSVKKPMIFLFIVVNLVFCNFILAWPWTFHPFLDHNWHRSKGDSAVQEQPSTPASVRGFMQKHPGGPVEEVEVAVHPAPVNPLSLRASQVNLSDEDLVLGVVIDGQAIAYPIRYLALYEIVDDQINNMPVAPTW